MFELKYSCDLVSENIGKIGSKLIDAGFSVFCSVFFVAVWFLMLII